MNDMDWIILATLNEKRNITKTANQLLISQPALSYRINRLEEDFNSKLFIRNRKGVHLTPQGEYLVQYAQMMLRQLQETKETLQSMETDIKGTIKIGVSSTVGQYMLPGMLRDYLNQYPDVDVNVVTGFSSEIESILLAGDIHIAIIRGNQYWHEKKILLQSEPLLVASKATLNIEHLPKMDRIYYKTDSSLKGLIDNWWKEIFNDPTRISMEVGNLETCKEMVKMGLGYAILPAICLKDEKNLFVQPLYDSKGDRVERETWAYCRDSSIHFPPVQAFLDYLEGLRKPEF